MTRGNLADYLLLQWMNMAVKPSSIIWLFCKWLLVPIILGLAGFFIIGPRIPGTMPTVDPQLTDPDTAAAPIEPTAKAAKFAEPKVDVEVDQGSKSKFGRKRKKKPAVPSPTSSIDSVPPDWQPAPPGP